MTSCSRLLSARILHSDASTPEGILTFSEDLKFYFKLLYMRVGVGYALVGADACGSQKRALGPEELELQVCVVGGAVEVGDGN